MGTYLDRDLPPYVRAAGNMAQPYGINSVGLRRRGLTGEKIDAIKRAGSTGCPPVSGAVTAQRNPTSSDTDAGAEYAG